MILIYEVQRPHQNYYLSFTEISEIVSINCLKIYTVEDTKEKWDVLSGMPNKSEYIAENYLQIIFSALFVVIL